MVDTSDDKSALTQYPILPLLAERWSPRGFDRAYEISADELGALLEAARWSPSSSNSQPWRLVVAPRESEEFARITPTLEGSNGLWAPLAAALIVVCAATIDAEGKPLRWAEYDAGQAAAHLSIQAESMGLSVHQMGGFRPEDLRLALGLPDDVKPMSVIAVGRQDSQAELPDFLAERERAPRKRLALDTIVLNNWQGRGD